MAARGHHTLLVALRLATAELKLDSLIHALERWYRPDQPRAPRGTPIGGQWIRDRTRVAGTRCDGFAAGCQNGGSFGSSGFLLIDGKRLCWDCAIKYLGIQNLSRKDQLTVLRNFDPLLRE